jgi:uncharacterized repeat protein (TIGR01451 family)
MRKWGSVLVILVVLCSMTAGCIDKTADVPSSPASLTMTSPSSPYQTSRELTYEEAQQIKKSQNEFFKPDLTVNVTINQSQVAPGDRVIYSVNVSNIGTGPAISVQLVDNFPDGTIEQRNLRDVNAGGVLSERFMYRVPLDIADGTVLLNRVSVSGKNMKGDADNETNNACLTSIIISSQ